MERQRHAEGVGKLGFLDQLRQGLDLDGGCAVEVQREHLATAAVDRERFGMPTGDGEGYVAIVEASGRSAPRANAIPRLTIPAPTPLIAAI